MSAKRFVWQWHNKTEEEIPTAMIENFAKAYGNKSLLKQATMLGKAQKRIVDMQGKFQFFMHNTWIFESLTIEKFLASMNEWERSQFRIDVRQVDWEKGITGFLYGIRRFYIKEDCIPYEAGFKQILAQNQIGWFQDVKQSQRITRDLVKKDNRAYFATVMSQTKFDTYLK